MANPEHVEILNQGVEKWNTWRAENTGVKVNLMSTDLFKANLSGLIFMMPIYEEQTCKKLI